jgi:hypothetical protein
MKKVACLVSVLVAFVCLGITPLLGPAWSKPLAPAWKGGNFKFVAYDGTHVGYGQSGSSSTSTRYEMKWICVCVYTDKYDNLVSDENKVFPSEGQARQYLDLQYNVLESNGFRKLTSGRDFAAYEGYLNDSPVLCNVFIRQIYTAK